MLEGLLNMRKPAAAADSLMEPAPKAAPKAPKAPKEPKAAKEPKEPKAAKAPKSAPGKPRAKVSAKSLAKNTSVVPVKVVKSGMDSLSNSNFKRHAILAGIKRIQGKENVYRRCKHLTKALIAEIIENCVVMMKTSKKSTLTASMVLFEAQRQGKTVFWTDPSCQQGPRSVVSKKKEPKAEEAAKETAAA